MLDIISSKRETRCRRCRSLLPNPHCFIYASFIL